MSSPPNAAVVKYMPTVISVAEIRRAVSAAGVELAEPAAAGEDAEARARRMEIARQKRRLIWGLIFTVPLFLLAMGARFDADPRIASAERRGSTCCCSCWPRRCSSTWAGSTTSARSRRCAAGEANMDVLIAMGSSAAYFYSLPVAFGLLPGHVYFETAAVIITLIVLGKFLEARAKGRTSEALRKLRVAAGANGARHP